MLEITVTMFSTSTHTVTQVAPSLAASLGGEVVIGQLQQYHFVALLNKSGSTHDCGDSEVDLDDKSIEGDIFRREISGAPLESVLTAESPEVNAQVYSVAPGGQIPIPIMTDHHFEELQSR